MPLKGSVEGSVPAGKMVFPMQIQIHSDQDPRLLGNLLNWHIQAGIPCFSASAVFWTMQLLVIFEQGQHEFLSKISPVRTTDPSMATGGYLG